MTTRRFFLGGMAASAVAATLAACGQEVATTPAPATGTPEPYSALDSERLTSILERLKAGLAEADTARTAESLSDYLVGPAARNRAEQYALASALGDDTRISQIVFDSAAGAAGLAEGFPRTAVVVSQQPEASKAPWILVLSQDEARDNFKLWGWGQLFPGTRVPETPTAAAGTEAITADSTGLVSTPAEVLAAYVDALNDPSGANGATFANDQDRIRAQVATDRAINDQVSTAGTVTVTVAAGTDGFRGLRTADGGAIVMTTLTYTTEFKRTVKDAGFQAGPTLGKMLGGDDAVRGTVTATYDAMVAFSIPAEDSAQAPVALGGSVVLASATRDDSKSPA
ncbi:hypothetical protein CHIBA101_0791 [Actinomyces sp. Chiba101]|uniref:hypothetical protein n=1 Tax=Actinomyces TaxID=1654 RepID=UPI000974E556|nr:MULTISPECIES: hypothetical protein [Actinomyces]BAW92657.1 hypothetical protein CHIBA101_0791 [Actinomyces sp. Chiba101]GAV94379.1 hypothetical protein ADENT20671_1148 [Actinomyces denticolens]SUU07769.1 Uncharacterised protein [Actinomyces denticolens]